MKKYLLLIGLIFSASTILSARTMDIPFELREFTSNKFGAEKMSDIQVLPDGEHYAMLSPDKKKIFKYSFKTGEMVETIFDGSATRETKIDEVEGFLVSPTELRVLVWNKKEKIYRRSWKADIYEFDVRRNYLKPLSDQLGKIMVPVFSPDGRMCAFVRDNNIWLKKFDFDTESEVTKDGNIGNILNGITDWVYEEEFLITHLISWSPDNKMLAFLKSDETNVPVFSMQQFDGALYPGYENVKYPKAGEINSTVGCYTYNVDSKDVKKMDIPLENDGYIPLIKFTENPEQLAVLTLNRNQNMLNLFYVNPKSGVPRLILKEESKYYIEPELLKYITFTKDNFIYLSDESGYTHIYLYSTTGILQKQVTSGHWDVTDFYGIDPVSLTVYFQSAEESPLQRSIYKVDNKGNKTKLSTKTGTNNGLFSKNFNYFINSYSNIENPGSVTLHESSKGKELTVLKDNKNLEDLLAGKNYSQKEFFTFSDREGIELNGWMLRPTGFSSSQKYPVIMFQYSGPGSQMVLDKFDFGWEYYLASQGYIVVSVDGKGTGARGREFKKRTYLNLGIEESDDQIAAAVYLSSLPYIDKNRIGIWGWSYGGYNTLMSMSRGNGIFKAGIAVAPVTDWKLYDTIYTERYMRTPNENFNGYKNSSPVSLTSSLQGRVLLVHGTSDDNVHYQNTLYYADKLIEEGKLFDMQIYPGKDHGIAGDNTRYHLYKTMTDFFNRELK